MFRKDATSRAKKEVKKDRGSCDRGLLEIFMITRRGVKGKGRERETYEENGDNGKHHQGSALAHGFLGLRNGDFVLLQRQSGVDLKNLTISTLSPLFVIIVFFLSLLFLHGFNMAGLEYVPRSRYGRRPCPSPSARWRCPRS